MTALQPIYQHHVVLLACLASDLCFTSSGVAVCTPGTCSWTPASHLTSPRFWLCDLVCQTLPAGWVGSFSFLFWRLSLLLGMLFSILLGLLFTQLLAELLLLCRWRFICWMSALRLQHPSPELSLKLLFDRMPALFRARRSAASAVTAPVMLTPCLRSRARDSGAASSVVANDERVHDHRLSCAWRTARVQGSHTHVCLPLVGTVGSPPSSHGQPILFQSPGS